VLRVGLISDTHGLLRPQALAALAGSHRIVHAGDIGDPAILDALRAIAPVTAVRGNNDRGSWAGTLADVETLAVGGVRLLVIHDVGELDRAAMPDDVRVVVSGHSHRPAVAERDGVLYVNPGSAGPRRFTLPVSIGAIAIGGGDVNATLIELDVAAGAGQRFPRARSGS
jgi:putative phosphoesterase